MLGDATIEAGTEFESDFPIRERQDGAAEVCMARAAVELIELGITVMINDGSMAAALGAAVTERPPPTAITNNGAVIDRLRTAPGMTLVALVDVLLTKFNVYFGVILETALSRLLATLAFISAPTFSGPCI